MKSPCPICQQPVAAAPSDPAAKRNLPFCSERCKLVDLGRWLSGDYAFPAEPDPDDPMLDGLQMDSLHTTPYEDDY